MHWRGAITLANIDGEPGKIQKQKTSKKKAVDMFLLYIIILASAGIQGQF